MNPRRALLLINPHSRSGEESERIVRDETARLGLELVPPGSTPPNEFSDMIRRHAKDVDLVIVAGGDGSVNAALPGLLETGLPLAVIPLGTSNNLARGLGIPLDLPAACALIATGAPKTIDVASVNEIPFIVVAGMGVSIRVNREVKSEFKRRFGRLAYIFTAFRVFRNFRTFRVEITTPKRSLCLDTLQISVCNGRYFGSNLTVAEDASLTDGALDLCSVEVKHWWQIPGLAWAMRKGEFSRHHPIFHLRAEELTLSTKRPMDIDTDGEISTRTPARFKLRHAALSVIHPIGPELAPSVMKL